MQYALLIYSEEAQAQAMAEADLAATLAAMDTWDGALDRRKLGSARLAWADSATTVRVRDGRAVTTDGPFAETKEALGGLYLIESADLDEALELARTMPLATFCSIEVRPLWHVNQRPGGKD